MKKRDAVTPPQVLEDLLRVAGLDTVLVGGQALAIWVAFYAIPVPHDVPAISADVDFLVKSAANKTLVNQFAQALHGKTDFPSAKAMTSLVGQAYRDTGDDKALNVDVLFKLIGIDTDAVLARAVELKIQDITFKTMHPLHVLLSRLANLYQLAEKQNDEGRMQLDLAIQMARQFLRAKDKEADAGSRTPARSPIANLVREIEDMALSDAGRKVAKREGLHVADAIDLMLMPPGLFWENKWPQLSELMSPQYVAALNLPTT